MNNNKLSSHPNFRVYFLIAVDFVKLTLTQKIQVGWSLGVLDNYDLHLPELELEEVVFQGAIDSQQLPALVKEINKAMVHND